MGFLLAEIQVVLCSDTEWRPHLDSSKRSAVVSIGESLTLNHSGGLECDVMGSTVEDGFVGMYD